MKKNETKSHCKYYDWGLKIPSDLGVFCTYKKVKAFFITKMGKLKPQCWGCKNYKKREQSLRFLKRI